MYVDDCCKLRRAIQSVLGNEIVVKLDLFHRITKRHPRFHDCMCKRPQASFQKDGDVSQERLSHTAPKEVIASKLVRGVTDEFGNHILTCSSMQAISNLEKHVNAVISHLVWVY